MKKKAAILITMMLIITASLAAVTFTWSSTYDDVTHYRFQFNTDKADNWIVVGPYDTKRSYDLPAGTTLYVQQSLDGGKTWSKSAKGVYDPATAEPWIEEAPAKDPLRPQQIPVVREDTMTMLAEKKAGTAAKKPAPDIVYRRPSRFALTFRVPSVAMDPKSRAPFTWDQYVGLQFKAKNLVSPNSWFSLHLAFNLDFGMLSNGNTGFPKNPWTETEKSLGLDMALYMSFLIDRKVDLYLGPAFGVDMLMYPEGMEVALQPRWLLDKLVVPNEIFGLPPFRLGATLYAAADLGFEYNFNSVFAVGIGVRYKYWFQHFDALDQNRMSVGANVNLSFTF